MKALFQLFENLRCCCFLRELACTADPLSPIQLGVHIDHVHQNTRMQVDATYQLSADSIPPGRAKQPGL